MLRGVRGMVVIFRNKAETEFGFKEVFEEQGYLQHGITLRDGDVIFDVGANIGMFALNVATRCKNPVIYSFEPIPPVFELLKLNTSLYGLNVKPFNCGLSREERSETFTNNPQLSLISSKLAATAAERETVKALLPNEEKTSADEKLVDELLTERLRTSTVTYPMKTLSQVMREQKIDHIDLLKIDVEKSELDVIAGIEPQDWWKIRQLVVEVYDQEGRVERILEMLRGLGYEVATEQDVVLKDTSYQNVFAIRRNRAADARPTTCNALPQWRSPDRLINDVREYVKGKLPDYMVPSAFMLMDELPLSPNGKIDRKALPAPDAVLAKCKKAYLAPRNATEERLAGIVGSVLGEPRVGVQDNFFELGGHSLLATQVISQIRETFRVELPLRSIFEAPTVAALAQTIQSTREPAAELQAPLLVPVPRTGDLPLSFGQQRLWFLDQLLPGSAAYNIAPAFILKGLLNAAALEQAFREIVRRHEALRTVFATVGDQPVQRVMPTDFFGWKAIDLADVPVAQREAEARRLADEEAQCPFDLAHGPLLRVKLVRVEPEHHVLLVTMPHIVSDGWSLAAFCQELSALYGAFCAGEPSPLTELPIQFADYAAWQRNWLQGKVLEEQLGYWKQQLAGVPTKIELPSDYPRPPVQTLRGSRYFLNFPTTLSEAAAALGREEETTLFMTLLAAFNAFLYTYTGQEDFLIGSPFANRTRLETQGLIGPFVNTLVLRTHLAGNPTFRDLLHRVREVVLGADAHQGCPFEKIVEVVRPPRDPSRNPLFQFNFRVLTGPLLLLRLPGLTSSLLINECENSKFDLALELWVNPDRFGGYIEYSTDLFEQTTIRRMSSDFELLLADLLARPDTRLSDLAALKDCTAGLKKWQEVQRAKREEAKNKSLRDMRRKRI